MEKRGGELIGAVIVFFVILFVYTKFVGPIPFTVNNINTVNSTPFEVQGIGKASAAPDTAVINLGVTATGATALEAQEKANQSAQRIINGLKQLGVPEKDIKTINYSVNPNYSVTGEQQRITGYSVTQSFEVKVAIDKANQVVDGATSNGANLVGGVSFTLNDKRLEQLRNEARKEAVDNAKASAQGLAKASGIRLGNIINVRESFGGIPPQPLLAREAVGVDEQKTETNITPGETNIEVTVSLTYQTR